MCDLEYVVLENGRKKGDTCVFSAGICHSELPGKSERAQEGLSDFLASQ